MSIFEAIGSILQAKQHDKAMSFRELAAKLADGASVDPKTAAGIVEAAGKGPADLEAEVKRIQAWRQHKATLVSEPEHQVEQSKVTAELEALIAERDSYRASIDARIVALAQRRDLLVMQRNQFGHARNQLWRLAAPELLAEHDSLQAQSIDITAKVDNINRQADSTRELLGGLRAKLERLKGNQNTNQATIDACQADVEGAEQRLAQLGRYADDLQAQRAEINRQQAAIKAKAMQAP